MTTTYHPCLRCDGKGGVVEVKDGLAIVVRDDGTQYSYFTLVPA